jgi:thioredoxin reductase (NADPH)
VFTYVPKTDVEKVQKAIENGVPNDAPVRMARSRDSKCPGQIQIPFAGGIPVRSRSVVVASGAQYRKLSVENYGRFENCGIYYAATAMES